MRPAVQVLLILATSVTASAGDGNRLAYLEENNPYYPHTGFAKLTTPQWVGEPGVEAVVILAIDDMREPAKYEAYLRPILQRLKQIDGRAPVSIMTCSVKPDDPQLAAWLGEGLSLEVHTVDHPCPLLQGGDFAKAKSTYDRCVDLLHQVPGNKPVAFRMPCCDSLNTVSPRFYAEIFNSVTPEGNHLAISSSVFNVFTKDDPAIPKELVTDADGRERFRKYLPKNLKRGEIVHNNFVNWIENYPYPYVINRLCWEFPCVVPSDWEANHLHQPNNPETVRDMQAALDITVLKQGVYCLVFHPHGWIKSEQVVELIDDAVARHGGKVKFLTFREALKRLNENLLIGHPLRDDRGQDNGLRVVDVDNDGCMDVVIGHTQPSLTRVWTPGAGVWKETELPLGAGISVDRRVNARTLFTIAYEHGRASIVEPGASSAFREHLLASPFRAYTFALDLWVPDRRLRALDDAVSPPDPLAGRIRSFVNHVHGFRDIDDDGVAEAIWNSREIAIRPPPSQFHVSRWNDDERTWKPVAILNQQVLQGLNELSVLRFVDLNADGRLDIVFSNSEHYGVWLFKDMQTGWSIELLSGKRGERKPEEELPPIVRADGTDNGFFVHSGSLYWQNEDTAQMPDMVERRTFAELLKGRASSTE